MRYEVQGRTVALPVEVRRASSWAATFLVPARAAQDLIAHTGLEVARPFPGRALVSIPFVRYEEGDLDAYDEVGIAVAVRAHDAVGSGTLALARGRVCVYVHHLPVNRPFTLEAGRTIWGYPKFLADIAIDHVPGRATCTLRHDGRLVLALTVRNGGPIPLPGRAPPTYTFLDGVLRRTEWEMRGARVRGRLGGAALALGPHPIAEELRALGLPRRAFMSQTIPSMRARFGAAEIVSSAAGRALPF